GIEFTGVREAGERKILVLGVRARHRADYDDLAIALQPGFVRLRIVALRREERCERMRQPSMEPGVGRTAAEQAIDEPQRLSSDDGRGRTDDDYPALLVHRDIVDCDAVAIAERTFEAAVGAHAEIRIGTSAGRQADDAGLGRR